MKEIKSSFTFLFLVIIGDDICFHLEEQNLRENQLNEVKKYADAVIHRYDGR